MTASRPCTPPYILANAFQGVLPHKLVLDIREQPIGLEISDRGDRDAADTERARQAAAEVHGSQNVVAVGVELPGRPSEPALASDVIGQTRCARCPSSGSGSGSD